MATHKSHPGQECEICTCGWCVHTVMCQRSEHVHDKDCGLKTADGFVSYCSPRCAMDAAA